MMALDVGNRRIGVAVTDPLGLFARPVTTLMRTRPEADRALIAGLVREWSVERLVVGLPLLPSGDRGKQAESAEAFAADLARAIDVPIDLWDESYTTLAASARLRERGVDLRRDRSALDATAAAVILEEWLGARHGVRLPPPEDT
jgi:putative holliday junction resolvase